MEILDAEMLYPWYICPNTPEDSETLKKVVRNSY